MQSSPERLNDSLKNGIKSISDRILEMAGLCEAVLKDSLLALLNCDGKRAYSVIYRDQKIDEMEKSIDRLCLEFLIRQQPAGEHLRFVYAAIKINSELERIGDYAESIAKQSLTVGSMAPDIDFKLLTQLAETAIPMVRQAAEAFVRLDESLARQVIEQEEKANELRDQVNVEMERLRQASRIDFALYTPLLTIGRRFERVSDQCKNMAEETLYVCTGQYMKHLGSEVFRILFVDDDDSRLTQVAAGLAESFKTEGFVFNTAGISPKAVTCETVQFMKNRGIDISNAIAKPVEVVPNLEHYHFIVALSRKALTIFPKPPTRTIGLEWYQGLEELGAEPSLVDAHDYLQKHISALIQDVLGQFQ